MNSTFLSKRIIQLSCVSNLKYQQVRSFATKTKEDADDTEIPKNPLRDVYTATQQKENGKIYDRKPFKIECKKGKIYHWCLCGQSKNQPLCDGTHNNIFLKIKLKPIKFTVTKTKDYWLCNCKQTRNRPFCDGTHKELEVPGYSSTTKK